MLGTKVYSENNLTICFEDTLLAGQQYLVYLGDKATPEIFNREQLETLCSLEDTEMLEQLPLETKFIAGYRGVQLNKLVEGLRQAHETTTTE